MSNQALALISGAYTSDLLERLEEVLTNESSLLYVHQVLEALHDLGNNKAALGFVRTLYDVTGLVLPDIVDDLDNSEETRSAYIAELLADIENIV